MKIIIKVSDLLDSCQKLNHEISRLLQVAPKNTLKNWADFRQTEIVIDYSHPYRVDDTVHELESDPERGLI